MQPVVASDYTRIVANGCDVKRQKMAEVHGNRTSVENTGNIEVGLESDAESGAVGGVLPHQVDSDLKVVIESWSTLPSTVKADILAIVQASGK